MILQQILTALDTELDRLGSLRTIIAGLSKPLKIDLPPNPDVDASAAADTDAQPIDVLIGAKLTRRKRSFSAKPVTRPAARSKAAAPPASALSHAVSHGPVVVSANQVARERQARLEITSPAKTPPADPDLVARNLAARWLSGGTAASA